MTIMSIVKNHNRAKLIIIGATTLLSSIAALLILFVNIQIVQTQLKSELQGFVALVGTNLQVPLTFRDPASAEEVLKLTAHPSITQACVYGKNGNLFVQGAKAQLRCPINTGSIVPHTALSIPIQQHGEGNEATSTIGTLAVYTNRSQIERFREHIIWPSIGIIAGFVLLVVAPISAFIQRKTSLPVLQLVDKAHALLPAPYPSRTNDISTALQVIELAGREMLRLSQGNQQLKYKAERILTNVHSSFSTLKSDVQISQKIVTINKSMFVEHPVSRGAAIKLFEIAYENISETDARLDRYLNLANSFNTYLEAQPVTTLIDDVVEAAYQKYYKNFQRANVRLKTVIAPNTTTSFFTKEFECFLYSFFLIGEMIGGNFSVKTVQFSCDPSPTILGRLNCRLSIDFSEESLDVMAGISGHNLLMESENLDENMKSAIENMKFFASLNSSDAALTIEIHSQCLVIKFNLDGQVV